MNPIEKGCGKRYHFFEAAEVSERVGEEDVTFHFVIGIPSKQINWRK